MMVSSIEGERVQDVFPSQRLDVQSRRQARSFVLEWTAEVDWILRFGWWNGRFMNG